jgi:hypothetical protein
MPSLAEHGPLGPPPTLRNDDCESFDTIKVVLQEHALANGYAINSNCSTLGKAAWVCSKSGKHCNQKSEDVLENKR